MRWSAIYFAIFFYGIFLCALLDYNFMKSQTIFISIYLSTFLVMFTLYLTYLPSRNLSLTHSPHDCDRLNKFFSSSLSCYAGCVRYRGKKSSCFFFLRRSDFRARILFFYSFSAFEMSFKMLELLQRATRETFRGEKTLVILQD